ncbi:Forkhead-associated protein [Thalassoporum mexicanum PCC 7367]|uniref:FHA domain-containing protein n=1 Tax=Thalassoporum mexicanum TaxID=3457544 RepID=UPI00029F9764|nr:FHA domain-containing protein [Pseudanabaena sp. PCC 7367]AFY71032.1 Forkhead-associated protein [Pseudanabaena sp. PCC 7367]
MPELTLEWTDINQRQCHRIGDQRVRIGRDPARCDLIIQHPTVSALQAEIFFNADRGQFYVRDLRGEPNPPLVDGVRITGGEAALHPHSLIYLGQVAIKIAAIVVAANADYGLRCPNPRCGREVAYEYLELACPWCGTSLAAAASTILP